MIKFIPDKPRSKFVKPNKVVHTYEKHERIIHYDTEENNYSTNITNTYKYDDSIRIEGNSGLINIRGNQAAGDGIINRSTVSDSSNDSKKISCPACGNLCDSKDKFCSKCGRKL